MPIASSADSESVSGSFIMVGMVRKIQSSGFAQFDGIEYLCPLFVASRVYASAARI